MSDIFICYSSKNREVADRLHARLRAEAWTVWMDIHTLTGAKWRKEIKKQLAEARCVVVLWSAAAEDSNYVMDEAEDAMKRGILVPALIESMALPYGFRQVQTSSLIGWNDEETHAGMQSLLVALRVRLNQENASTEPVAPVRASSLAPGQTYRDKLKIGGEGPLMVLIPAGRFMMGSPDDESGRRPAEGPQHEVAIARPFALGVHALTFDDYDRYTAARKVQQPQDASWGRGKRPVINVTWDEAQAYCTRLSEQTGRTYRLPSEAEWEYACRAGTTTPFHCGERITTDQANFDGRDPYIGSATGEYRAQTVPVGSFAPNAFGLYDMHGNVWEWCQDGWHDSYEGAPADGSAWESSAVTGRVLRGGSWDGEADYARCAGRGGGDPGNRDLNVGFRVLCSSPIVEH